MAVIPIFFRKLDHNHYSIAKLIGLIDEFFTDSRVCAYQWKFFNDLDDHLSSSIGSRRIFAYSFMTPALDVVAQEIALLRQKCAPEDWIIAGGPHATADPVGCRALGFDAVFVGESERTLLSFLKNVIDGAVPGEPQVICDTNPEPIVLDEYPPFAYKRDFVVPIELTRGCANRCVFCQAPYVHGAKLRFRSLDGLTEPFRHLQTRNRRKVFFITSNVLSYGPSEAASRADSLRSLAELAHSFGLADLHLGSFPSEIRPEYLDEGCLRVFRDYCINRIIVIGAQTGSERLLATLRRGHTVADVKQAALMVRNAGFKPYIDIIIGLPDETTDDRRQTMEFITWLMNRTGARIHLHHYIPLPGTSLWPRPPSVIDTFTRNELDRLIKHGRACGDIWLQKKVAALILDWRARGIIRT